MDAKLILNALEQSKGDIPLLEKEVKTAAAFFYAGDIAAGYEKTSFLLKIMKEFISFWYNLAVSFDGTTALQKLNGRFIVETQQMNGAMKKRDFLELADILHYKTAETISGYIKHIPLLEKTVSRQ